MKMTHIEIPGEFHRNSPNVVALGIENTGEAIINRGNELLGLPDLSDKDVLDIGCGARFTQTIINRSLPINSYTGVDIHKPVITYLADHVMDSRFAFFYWHLYNVMYNTKGKRLTKKTRLPFTEDRTFDVIWMYSVITHTYPQDAGLLFYVLRRYVRPEGGLLFSAFIDNNIETFEDRVKDQPLLNAYYNESYLKQIIAKNGWRVESRYDKWTDGVSQNLFLCRPTDLPEEEESFWKRMFGRR